MIVPVSEWEAVPGRVVGLYANIATEALKIARAIADDPPVRVFYNYKFGTIRVEDPALRDDAKNGLDRAFAYEKAAGVPVYLHTNQKLVTHPGCVLIKDAHLFLVDGNAGREDVMAGPDWLVAAVVGGVIAAAPHCGFKYAHSASVFDDLDLGVELDDRVKAAVANQTGALYTPSIPVDAFNRAVWADVRQAPNPWGTRDPFGDGDAPMTTPPQVAAAVSGIVSGAGAAGGSHYVSPWQVGLTAAVTAGKGYAAGLVLGKTLGALAGLSQDSQDSLRRTGMWGGLITGAANALFNSAGE